MALSAPRKIARRSDGLLSLAVAAAAVCIQSGLAIVDDGYARPARAGQGGTDFLKAADAATQRVVGVFVESVTGGVADGDARVNVQTGEFNFDNSAGADAITLADIGKTVFVVDDETVARTSAGGTRAAAGILVDIDSAGVWVRVGPGIGQGRTLVLPFVINETDLLAGTAFELVSPVAGAIIRATGIVQKAVTTGGDITLAVGVTAVDGLTLTVADAATKGTVVTDTPTNGHASTLVAPGSRIQVVPAAAFNTAGAMNGTVEIAY
ncbi:hypothetical protein [Caulobacter sp. SLTY]|uniref:hypothetical protein n=1 Tax=Caulobacter sp. SLTY TaxID=2683262 RepID=UPI00196B35F1|nr:hypothetical protein [Caulobacter sp. SLTY]